MIRYLVLFEVVELHRQVIEQSGGALGIRDLGALESALAQPRMTFGGEDLYPTLVDKAAAIGFSLIMNHPFIDGNKRIGHAAMEVFLVMNGWKIDADVDEQEAIILSLASGKLAREAFRQWLKTHVKVI
ncbi:type II toxin-antitoxin system death-on-curing family toxin [Halotia branconii]|uniref:Type II toxin-antitoxin system death-on-curing family toxin n=1 Tax=Halotia branconii CENA392 TaxID=1539056 RepID=A0AAJ6NPU7_9CYAN|nr:type II toxin-antitoxin system death-on-curing family toxin [Halotia branconii]WGV24382.1 type II toxin-antitoxin system death-on-curing family toxin [Halotia branconii CENA392]